MQEPPTFQQKDQISRQISFVLSSHAGLASLLCAGSLILPALVSSGKISSNWMEAAIASMTLGWSLCVFQISKRWQDSTREATKRAAVSLICSVPASWLFYQCIGLLLHLLTGIYLTTLDVFPSAMTFVQSAIDVLTLSQVGLSIVVPLSASFAWHHRLVTKMVSDRKMALSLTTVLSVSLVMPAASVLFGSGKLELPNGPSESTAFLAVAIGLTIAFGILSYLSLLSGQQPQAEAEGSPL